MSVASQAVSAKSLAEIEGETREKLCREFEFALRRTWDAVAMDAIAGAAEIDPGDFSQKAEKARCRVSFTADDVRSMVYDFADMYIHEHSRDLLKIWKNLSYDDRDTLMMRAFPDRARYGY